MDNMKLIPHMKLKVVLIVLTDNTLANHIADDWPPQLRHGLTILKKRNMICSHYEHVST
jgi:hypothetical protein